MFMKPQPSSASKMKAGTSSSSVALKQEGAMKEEGDKVVVAVRIRPLTSVVGGHGPHLTTTQAARDGEELMPLSDV